VATIVAPGAVALSPYLVVLGHYVPVVARFWTEHATAFGLIAALAVLIVGFLFDEIGALIEVHWDERLKRRYTDHAVVWRVYLQLKLKDDLVGQRYLRDVLTRMKFELAMSPALLVCALGLNWINHLFGPWSRWVMIMFSGSLAVVSGFFLWESYQSADLLTRTRRAIVDAMRLDSAADIFKPAASRPDV
jgi:uncharacterized membrane protein YgdD (TMEM256/DUF423 family)